MRIGFDARMIDWAGVGTYSFNLLKSLKEVDKENEYVLFCQKQNVSQVPEAANFGKKIISETVFSPFHQLFLSMSMRGQSLDLFHSPHFVVPLFLSCPAVVTIHDLIPLVFPQSMPSRIGRMYYRRAIKKAITKAKSVVVVSTSTKKDVLDNFDVPEEKIRVIANGVAENFTVIGNETLINGAKQRYKIHSKFLLSVGNPKPHKNWLGLIKAFAALKDVAHEYQLVLVGSRDPRYSEVDKLIKKLHLEEQVIITGFVRETDMSLLYNAAEVFVFPSLYEGFGLPILEAMACGAPVLCSNSSSLPEVAGDAALLIDLSEQGSLAVGIEKILSDEKLQKDLSKRGRERASSFSWQTTARKTLEAYEEITS